MSRQGQRVESPLITGRKFRPNTTPASMANSTSSSASISRRVVRGSGLDSSATLANMETLHQHNSTPHQQPHHHNDDDDNVLLDEELDTLPPSPDKSRRGAHSHSSVSASLSASAKPPAGPSAPQQAQPQQQRQAQSHSPMNHSSSASHSNSASHKLDFASPSPLSSPDSSLEPSPDRQQYNQTRHNNNQHQDKEKKSGMGPGHERTSSSYASSPMVPVNNNNNNSNNSEKNSRQSTEDGPPLSSSPIPPGSKQHQQQQPAHQQQNLPTAQQAPSPVTKTNQPAVGVVGGVSRNGGAQQGSKKPGGPAPLNSSDLIKPRPNSASISYRDKATNELVNRPFRINLGRKELIGKGSFGIVYRAMDLDTNHFIAVKEVSIPPGSVREEQLVRMRKEIAFMQKIDHPNVVRCLGEDWDEAQGTLRIYMSYVPGGSISSTLKSFGPFQEAQAAMYCKQVLEGLAYLHAMKIAHRDLKGENLLVEVDGRIKLADFGTAKEFATKHEANTIAGTAFFMAPEVIRGDGHGLEADIWSFGCCVIEMLTGKPPFSHFANQYAIMMHIADLNDDNFPFPENVSPQALRLMKRCLIKDASKRATAAQLLQDEWIVDPPKPSPNAPRVLHHVSESQVFNGSAGAAPGAGNQQNAGPKGGDTYVGVGDSFNPMSSLVDDE